MAHEWSLSFHKWFFQHCSLCIVEDLFQLASLVLKQIIMEKQNEDEMIVKQNIAYRSYL